MNIPIELRLDGKTVAKIFSFSYETPWATGEVKFEDESLFRKLVGVTSMALFDLKTEELDLEDEEEDKMWEAELLKLGLTWDDLELDNDDRWSIVPNGCKPQPIYSPMFYESGDMDWRL